MYIFLNLQNIEITGRLVKKPRLYNVSCHWCIVFTIRHEPALPVRNSYLYHIGKIHCPLCRCGIEEETVFHYFMKCPLYDAERLDLETAVSQLAPFTLPVVLHGSDSCTQGVNELIVASVLTYIKNSRRFA